MTHHIKGLNSKTPAYRQKLQHDVKKAVNDKKKINQKEIFEGYKQKMDNKKKKSKKKY